MDFVLIHSLHPRVEARGFICFCSAVQVPIRAEKGTRTDHKVTVGWSRLEVKGLGAGPDVQRSVCVVSELTGPYDTKTRRGPQMRARLSKARA
jgi:hypothetical protein